MTMPPLRTIASLLIVFLVVTPPDARIITAAEPAAQAVAARAVLDAWHADEPVAPLDSPAGRRLHVIAWRAKDRPFPQAHRERLDRIMTHIQAFYRREMERHGLGPRSIRLDRDEAGALVVHEVTGAGDWADYDGPDGGRIRAECVPVLREKGIDIDRETVMLFTNLAEWDPEKLTFRHRSPYYASGDWRRGTAWQLDSPELDVPNLPLKEPLVEDGQYGRISLGKHNSIFIGGIAHELGHALGLPHCRERPDEAVHGTALMGSGNRTYGDELRGEGRGSFLTLAHALRLASHPQFSGSVKGFAQDPRGTFAELTAIPGGDGRSFRVSGRVTGTPPVYAVIGYLDPAGGGDYDATTVSAVPDPQGRFTLDCTAVVPGKPAELRLVACHCNGGTTRMSQPYAVARDGTIDIETMQATFALAEFLETLATRGLDAASAVAPRDGPAARFATAVLGGRAADRETLLAAAEPPTTVSLMLSACRPAEARVGWLAPAYDQMPRKEAVLESAGRLHDSGIYAHAPALHRYDLGGSWRRLRGECGLPTQPGGSVVFVIRADGREVFRSPTLVPGKTARYDVDLTGVKTLELATEDAGDGRAADWGLWLAPELLR